MQVFGSHFFCVKRSNIFLSSGFLCSNIFSFQYLGRFNTFSRSLDLYLLPGESSVSYTAIDFFFVTMEILPRFLLHPSVFLRLLDKLFSFSLLLPYLPLTPLHSQVSTLPFPFLYSIPPGSQSSLSLCLPFTRLSSSSTFFLFLEQLLTLFSFDTFSSH